MSALRVWGALVAALGLQPLLTQTLLAGQPTAQTFDANGVKLRYLSAGQGVPVVLLHGLHSSAALNWQATGVIGDLAKDHWVIALDLPGHGRSDKPERADAYGLQVVEDVIMLLDHLKIRKAHIVGYSLGGMIAGKLMTRYPDRVLSVTLGGMGWFRAGSGLQNVWGQMPARGSTPAAFIHSIGQFAVTEEDLKKVNVPVQVIVGDRDPVRQMYVVPLQRVRKDWPVVEVKDAGHITCISKKEFREAIVSWVNAKTK